MANLTVRNVPHEVHRALRVRAAHSGRSVEAEVRAILQDSVMPENRVKLGSLLAEIGKQIQLTDEEMKYFERDHTPHTHIKLDCSSSSRR
ncbi:MAG: Arc family DNA-binding protein [Gammaproteobacteria bacterium]|nr:Arc family DNA-binding protein [Gammaproteobacteria bacterium]